MEGYDMQVGWKAGDKFRFKRDAKFHDGHGAGIGRDFRKEATLRLVHTVVRTEVGIVFVTDTYHVRTEDIEPVSRPMIIFTKKEK
jgi:hypothetical protein